MLFGLFLSYLYFRGIGDHGLLDPLEGVNASVGLTMLTRGDFFHPQVGSLAYGGKAMGAWWLSALSLILFRWGEFAVRFWSALAALGMALAAGRAASRPRGAWLAAAVSASMTLSFVVSQLASSHALYACCTAAAMAAFARIQDTGIAGGRRRAVLAHASALLAFIAHGPEGIILPWLAFVIYAAISDRLHLLRLALLDWAALPVSAAGLLGYLLLLYVKNPTLLLLMRYQSPEFLHPTGVMFLFFLLAGVIPWPGFLIQAALRAAPRSVESLQGGEGGRKLFFMVWAGTFALFAVLMRDVLALAACVPALAALIGESLDEWIGSSDMESVQRASALNIFILVPFLAAGIPLAVHEFPLLGGALLSIVPWAVFIAVLILANWYYARTRQMLKLARNVSAVALLCLMPLAGVFDLLAENRAVQAAGLALHNARQSGDVMVQYAENYPSLYFYTAQDYGVVGGPWLPGIAGQSFMSDTELHRLWGQDERVFLLIRQNRQPAYPMPLEVNRLMDAHGFVVLSNRNVPLQPESR